MSQREESGNGEQQEYDPEKVGPKMAKLLNDNTQTFSTVGELAGVRLDIEADGEPDRAKALNDALSAPARRMHQALEEDAEFDCPECDAEFFEMEEWQDHHLEQHYGEDDE